MEARRAEDDGKSSLVLRSPGVTTMLVLRMTWGEVRTVTAATEEVEPSRHLEAWTGVSAGTLFVAVALARCTRSAAQGLMDDALGTGS